ncbi:MAG: hypothetical protein WC458_04335, partial [Patescibacteria group bacterium]
MLKKSLVILIFALGLTVGFSVSAASGTCPTDNGAGVGCNIGIGEYYCLGSCRTGQTQCPTWTGTVCATGLSCPANCTAADSCGYCNACASGYTLCGSYPSQTCTANTPVPANCSSYSQCTAVCSACAQGYELVSGACIGATLKLGSDSVGALNHIFQSTSPSLYVLSSGSVGIGTSTPAAGLEVVSASGNASILAGLKRIGNVDLPFDTTDAATKGYVDSVVSASSSSLWGGTTAGNIWSLNSGYVGIGTTSPISKLHVVGDTYLNGNATSTGYLTITSSNNPSGNIRFTVPNPYITASSYLIMPGGLYVSGTGIAYFGTVRARGIVSNDTGPYLTISGGTSTATYISGTLGIGTNSPAAKLEVVSSTGNTSILAGLKRISNVDLPFAITDAATKGYVDTLLSTSTPISGAYLPLSGGTMIASSSINMNDGNITN